MIITYICRFLAWSLTVTAGITLYQIGKRAVDNIRTLHRIPCSGCQYFTNSPYVKCTVNPKLANTELAIDCHDFVSSNVTMV